MSTDKELKIVCFRKWLGDNGLKPHLFRSEVLRYYGSMEYLELRPPGDWLFMAFNWRTARIKCSIEELVVLNAKWRKLVNTPKLGVAFGFKIFTHQDIDNAEMFIHRANSQHIESVI